MSELLKVIRVVRFTKGVLLAMLILLLWVSISDAKCDGFAFLNPQKNKWAVGAPVTLRYAYKCPKTLYCTHRVTVGSSTIKVNCQGQTLVREKRSKYRFECNVPFNTVRLVLRNETNTKRANVPVTFQIEGQTCGTFNFSVKGCRKNYKTRRLRVVNVKDTDYNATGELVCKNPSAIPFLNGNPLIDNKTECEADARWKINENIECWSAPVPEVYHTDKTYLPGDHITFSCISKGGYPRKMTSFVVINDVEVLPSPTEIIANTELHNAYVYCISNNGYTSYYNYSVTSSTELINITFPPMNITAKLESASCEEQLCDISVKVDLESRPQISSNMIKAAFKGSKDAPNYSISNESQDGGEEKQTYKVNIVEAPIRKLKKLKLYTNVTIKGQLFTAPIPVDLSTLFPEQVTDSPVSTTTLSGKIDEITPTEISEETTPDYVTDITTEEQIFTKIWGQVSSTRNPPQESFSTKTIRRKTTVVPSREPTPPSPKRTAVSHKSTRGYPSDTPTEGPSKEVLSKASSTKKLPILRETSGIKKSAQSATARTVIEGRLTESYGNKKTLPTTANSLLTLLTKKTDERSTNTTEMLTSKTLMQKTRQTEPTPKMPTTAKLEEPVTRKTLAPNTPQIELSPNTEISRKKSTTEAGNLGDKTTPLKVSQTTKNATQTPLVELSPRISPTKTSFSKKTISSDKSSIETDGAVANTPPLEVFPTSVTKKPEKESAETTLKGMLDNTSITSEDGEKEPTPAEEILSTESVEMVPSDQSSTANSLTNTTTKRPSALSTTSTTSTAVQPDNTRSSTTSGETTTVTGIISGVSTVFLVLVIIFAIIFMRIIVSLIVLCIAKRLDSKRDSYDVTPPVSHGSGKPQ